MTRLRVCSGMFSVHLLSPLYVRLSFGSLDTFRRLTRVSKQGISNWFREQLLRIVLFQRLRSLQHANYFFRQSGLLCDSQHARPLLCNHLQPECICWLDILFRKFRKNRPYQNCLLRADHFLPLPSDFTEGPV